MIIYLDIEECDSEGALRRLARTATIVLIPFSLLEPGGVHVLIKEGLLRLTSRMSGVKAV